MKKITLNFICLIVISLFTINGFAQQQLEPTDPLYDNNVDIKLENIRIENTSCDDFKLCFEIWIKEGQDFYKNDPFCPFDYSTLHFVAGQIRIDILGVPPAAIDRNFNPITYPGYDNQTPFIQQFTTQVMRPDPEEIMACDMFGLCTGIELYLDNGGIDIEIGSDWVLLTTIKVNILNPDAFMIEGNTVEIRKYAQRVFGAFDLGSYWTGCPTDPTISESACIKNEALAFTDKTENNDIPCKPNFDLTSRRIMIDCENGTNICPNAPQELRGTNNVVLEELIGYLQPCSFVTFHRERGNLEGTKITNCFTVYDSTIIYARATFNEDVYFGCDSVLEIYLVCEDQPDEPICVGDVVQIKGSISNARGLRADWGSQAGALQVPQPTVTITPTDTTFVWEYTTQPDDVIHSPIIVTFTTTNLVDTTCEATYIEVPFTVYQCKTYCSFPPTVTSPFKACPGGEPTFDELTNNYVQARYGAIIKWYENDGTEIQNLSSKATFGNWYKVTQITDCESEPSYIFVQGIETLKAPELATEQQFCGGGNFHTSDILLPAGVAPESLSWFVKVNGDYLPVGNNDLLATGTYYYVQSAHGCESDIASINITILETGELDPIDFGISFLCEDAYVNNINTYPYNPFTITWYYDSEYLHPIDLTVPLEEGTIYGKIELDDNGCILSISTDILFDNNAASILTYEPLDYRVCNDGIVAELPYIGYNVIWKIMENNVLVPVSLSDPLVQGKIYYAFDNYDEESCSVFNSSVHVIIGVQPPTVTTPIELCSDGGLLLSDVAHYVKGVNVKWYTVMGNLLTETDVINTGLYKVTQTIDGCESDETFVKIIVNNNLEIPAPVLDIQYFCDETHHLSDVVLPQGVKVIWYATSTSNTPLNPASTLIVQGNHYWAAAEVGTCEGTERTELQFEIDNTHHITLDIDDQSFCLGAVISDIQVPYANIVWYAENPTTNPNQIPLSETEILTTNHYWALIKSGNCVLAGPKDVSITVGDPEKVIAESEQTFLCGATVADLVATGFGMKWYLDDDLTTQLPPTTVVLDNRTYVAFNVNAACKSEGTSVTVSIKPLLPPTVPTIVEFCKGGTYYLSDLAAYVTHIDELHWYGERKAGVAELPDNQPLENGKTYYVIQTNTYTGAPCNSDTSYVTVKILDQKELSAPVIMPQFFCNADAPTLADVVLPVGVSVIWYNADDDVLPATTLIENGHTYYAALIAGYCESAARTELEFTLDNKVGAPAIPEEFSFCEGATRKDVVTGYDHLIWYFSGTTDRVPERYIFKNDEKFDVALSNNSVCTIETKEVTIHLNGLGNNVTETTQSFFCSAQVKDLLLTGYGIKWYLDENLTDPALALTAYLVNDKTYYAANTSDDCKGLAAKVKVTILPLIPPTAPTIVEFCNDRDYELNDLAAYVTHTGDLHWYSNPTITTELPNNTILTATTYYVSQGSGDCESGRSYITVKILAPEELSAPVIMPQSFCDADAPIYLSNVQLPAGVHVQWYADGIPVDDTEVLDPTNTVKYTAALLAGDCESAKTTELVYTIGHNVDAPAIANTMNFCEGATIEDIVTGYSHLFWYFQGTTDLVPDGHILKNGEVFEVALSDNTTDCNVAKATVNIYIGGIANNIATTEQKFCGVATVADLVVTGYGIKWYLGYDDVTGVFSNGPLPLGTPLYSQTYYAANTSGDCEILAAKVDVSVNPALLPPTIQTIVEFCNDKDYYLSNLAAYVAHTATLHWYRDADGTDEIMTDAKLAATTYYVSQKSGDCESGLSYVTVKLLAPEELSAPVIMPQTFCVVDNPTLDDVVLPVGVSVIWYNEDDDVLPATTLIENGHTYYAALIAGDCESAARVPVMIDLELNQDAPAVAYNLYFCAGATIADIVTGYDDLLWYLNGVLQQPTDALINNVQYKAVFNRPNTNCDVDSAVVMIHIGELDTNIATTEQQFCGVATVKDLLVTGYGIEWYLGYDDATGVFSNGPLPLGTTLSNRIYYAANTSGDCEILAAKVEVTIDPALLPPTVPTIVEFCNDKDYYLSDLAAYVTHTATLHWYSDAEKTTEITENPTAVVLIHNKTYYVSQKSGICESGLSYVTVKLLAPEELSAPVIMPQSFCDEDAPIYLSDVQLPAGVHVQWYANGVKVPATTEITSNIVYTAALLTGDCESAKTTELVYTIGHNVDAPAIAGIMNFCEGATIADIVTGYVNLLWYFEGELQASTDPLVEGIYEAAFDVKGDCEVERATVHIYIGTSNNNMEETTQTFCGVATVADLIVTGYGIEWYLGYNTSTGEFSNGPLLLGTPLYSQTYYAANTSGEDCKILAAKVEVTINGVIPPTVNSKQEFCIGATVADLNAQGNNIVWYNEQGVEQQPTQPLIPGGIYYATQRSADGKCESDYSSYVKVTVVLPSALTPPTVNDQTLCNGAVVNDIITDGSNGIIFYGSEDGNDLLDGTDLLTAGTYWAAYSYGNGFCESFQRSHFEIILGGQTLPAPEIDAQKFCEGATIADIKVATANIIWYAQDPVSVPNQTPLTPETVLTNTTYYATQGSQGACDESSSTPVTITIGEGADTPIVFESPITLCGAATLADIPVNGYGITWYDDPNGGTPLSITDPLPQGTHTYWAVQHGNGDCESNVRAEVEVTVHTILPPTVNSTQEFCANATVSDLNVQGNNIRWYAEDGAYLLPSTPLVNGAIYYATQSSNDGDCESALSSYVKVTILPASALKPPTVKNQTLCDGATMADIITDGSNGIIFYGSEDQNDLFMSDDLVTDRTYWAAYRYENGTGACESTNRTPFIVTLSENPLPAPEIDDQTFCDGATIADIKVPTNNIKWYNALDEELLPTTPLENNGKYYAKQTSGGTCGESTAAEVTITINKAEPPIATTYWESCGITTLADIPVTGYGITWYANESGGTPLSITTPIPVGENHFWVTQRGSNECESDTRVPVEINVSIIIPPTVNSNQEFCASATVADLNAQGNNIRWYNAAGTLLAPETPLTDGAIYYATQNNADYSCESIFSSYVKVSIVEPSDLTPPAVANQTLCNSATVADIITDGSNGIAIYAAENGGTPLADNTALITGTTYYAGYRYGEGANACQSTYRTPFTVTLSGTTPPAPVIPDQTFCEGATIADIKVPTNNIIWYATNTSTTPLDPATFLESGVYFASQTVGGTCAESSRTPVTITIGTPDAPEVLGGPFSFCGVATLADLPLHGYGIVWYEFSTGGTPLPETMRIPTGNHYYYAVQRGSNDCEGARAEIHVTVNALIPPTVNSTQEFCASATVADLNAQGNIIVWHDEDGNVLSPTEPLVDGAIYYATQETGDCSSVFSSYVKVTIVDPSKLTPPTVANQTLCTNATVADIVTDGSNGIVIYTVQNGGAPLAETDPLTDGATYWAGYAYGSGSNTCESGQRSSFTVQLTSGTLPPPDIELVQSFCEGATIADIRVPSANIRWYEFDPTVVSGQTPLAPEYVLLIGTRTYYAVQTYSGVCATESGHIAVTVNVGWSADQPVPLPVDLCGTVALADVPMHGYGIVWYATETSTNELPITTVIPFGPISFWAAQRGSDQCEGQRVKVDFDLDYCPDKLYLDVRVFLEGVIQPSGKFKMDGIDRTGNWMIHNLQDPAFQQIWKQYYGYDVKLPVLNPYTAYGVNDSYAQINNPKGPAGDVVDWVLVEIWGNITTTATDYNYSLIESRALLLKPDGTIRDTLNRKPQFTPYSATNIRIVVKHRNHASVMSMDLLPFVAGTIQYDFTVVENVSGTDKATHAYDFDTQFPVTIRYKVACLWAGDFDMDAIITDFDMDVFKVDFMASRMGGYILSDVTMDAYSNARDASFINDNFARKRSSVCRFFIKR